MSTAEYPQLSIVDCVLCFAAAVSGLAFKKQRLFPANLVIFIPTLGFFYNIYIVFYGMPGSPLNAVFNPNVVASDTMGCRAFGAIDLFFASGSLILNTELSFAIFMLFYLQRKMGMAHQIGFYALFWIFSLGFTVGPLVYPEPPQGPCLPSSTALVIVLLVCFCLLVTAQIILVGVTVYRIHVVSNNVAENMTENHSKLRKSDYWIYFRFVSIIITQVFGWIAKFVFYFLSLNPANYNTTTMMPVLASFLAASFYMNQIAYFVEPIVIMVSNRSLRQWLRATLNLAYSSSSATEVSLASKSQSPSAKPGQLELYTA